MLKNKIIAVDICNTLADVISELNARLGVSPTPDVYFHPGIKDRDYFKKNLDVFLDAKVLGNSNVVISELAKYNKIVYITARPKESELVTRIWLKKNGFPKGELHFTNDKPSIASKLGVDMAFEDAPHEIDNYRNNTNVEVLVKKQPYNLGYENLFDWCDFSFVEQVQADKKN